MRNLLENQCQIECPKFGDLVMRAENATPVEIYVASVLGKFGLEVQTKTEEGVMICFGPEYDPLEDESRCSARMLVADWLPKPQADRVRRIMGNIEEIETEDVIRNAIWPRA